MSGTRSQPGQHANKAAVKQGSCMKCGERAAAHPHCDDCRWLLRMHEKPCKPSVSITAIGRLVLRGPHEKWPDDKTLAALEPPRPRKWRPNDEILAALGLPRSWNERQKGEPIPHGPSWSGRRCNGRSRQGQLTRSWGNPEVPTLFDVVWAYFRCRNARKRSARRLKSRTIAGVKTLARVTS